MRLLNDLFSFLIAKGYLYIILLLGVILIYKFAMQQNFLLMGLLAGIPLLILSFSFFAVNLRYSFLALFILNYFIMGIGRYIPLKSGIIMTALSLAMLGLILFRNTFEKLDWSKARNSLVYIWTIWFVYCLLEVFNPEALFEPWSIAFTTYAFYPLLIAILIPLLFQRYKDMKWLLIIWAILTMLAAAKGYWQRNRGFDGAELYWLYVGGGASTHLIYTGVRYFSFFPDAANFGTGMGLSMVVFSIATLYVKNKWLKMLFAIAAIAGCYGMVISGTRSSMAVPFAGLTCFVILCKNYKMFLAGGLILILAFFFFNYTNIGNDNSLIRRMRSAFNFEDSSLQVRLDNQEKMKDYMFTKPLGVGLGLGGGKAKRFKPDAYMSQIPTDSWMVMMWVETGIVGIVLYLTLILIILYKCARIAMFKIKNKELRGILFAFIAGIFGIIVSSYGNEVLSYPNGIVVFTMMGLIFTAPYYDKEIEKDNTSEKNILPL